jgi:hypothetical protein
VTFRFTPHKNAKINTAGNKFEECIVLISLILPKSNVRNNLGIWGFEKN